MPNDSTEAAAPAETAGSTASDELLPRIGAVDTEGEQQQPPKATRLESFFAIAKSIILRVLIIYFISSFFRRQTPAATTNANTKVAGTTATQTAAWNYFENGTLFDMHVWLSEHENEVNFKQHSNLIWLLEELTYGDWSSGPNHDGSFEQFLKFRAPSNLLQNGSIYLHTFLTKSGQSPDPAAPNHAKFKAHQIRMLNKYKRIRVNRNYNLLAGEKEKFAKELQNANLQDTIVSHWHPNLTINLVVDQTTWSRGAVPPPLDDFVKFIDGGKTYLPILYLNDYWNLARDYFPINESTPELQLHLTFQPLGLIKWELYAAQQMRHKFAGNMLGELMVAGTEESDEDQDTLKEMLLDTNIYLLGLTIAISILHSIFEMLAFKNDIQFWNNRQSLEGLSVRSVFFGVFQSVIVLLYVLDNDTNFMIRLSCFVGLGIEVWKIHKVVDIKYNTAEKVLGIFPRVTFKDKGSYSESDTKAYDNLAFKYLGWLCFPLLVGYFIYSLLYNEHKGWYSFVLNMFYGYLLTFGFIMMTPQLFINYKLKSVAHMPWRMMTYKFLNTFIDDIFAFVIKMPTMYRLGCFRDDIIFFVFLYQRWQYRVDLKRVNEFGFSGEMLQKKQQAIDTKVVDIAATDAGAAGDVAQTDNKTPKSQAAKKQD